MLCPAWEAEVSSLLGTRGYCQGTAIMGHRNPCSRKESPVCVDPARSVCPIILWSLSPTLLRE